MNVKSKTSDNLKLNSNTLMDYSKTKTSNLIVASCLLAFSTQSYAEISANVAVTNDYVWRGISQNNEDPALQGGFDYEHDSGLYAGIWGSNVSFSNASTELDVYAGWAKEFDNGLGVDVGILEYTYHGSGSVPNSGDASDNNFTEYYIGLSHSGFAAQFAKGDEFDDHWQVSYEHDFDKISTNVGYFDYDSYSYYKVGVSTELANLDFALDYWDTDIKDQPLADGRLVLTVSKSF